MKARLDFIRNNSQAIHQSLCDLLLCYQKELRNSQKRKRDEDQHLADFIESRLIPSIDFLSQLTSKNTDPTKISCQILFDLYAYVPVEIKPSFLTLLVGLDFNGTLLMLLAANLANNHDVDLAYDLPEYLYKSNVGFFSNGEYYQYQLNLLGMNHL